MCGIIGYVGSPIPILQVVQAALLNKHRGSGDGVGIVFNVDGKLKVVKTLATLDRIANGKADINKDIDGTSDFIFLHHRKMSVGAISIQNTHPIEKHKSLFFHNGTLIGYDKVQKVFKELLKTENVTETDSEVIADSIILTGWKGTKNIFDSDVGVVLKIEEPGVFCLFKDAGRPFYIYKLAKGRYAYASEPLHMLEYEYAYYVTTAAVRLRNGHIEDEKKDGTYYYHDVTSTLLAFADKKLKAGYCSSCTTNKFVVVDAGKNSYGYKTDSCLDCIAKAEVERLEKEAK